MAKRKRYTITHLQITGFDTATDKVIFFTAAVGDVKIHGTGPDHMPTLSLRALYPTRVEIGAAMDEAIEDMEDETGE
jgi:hypothetical protein